MIASRSPVASDQFAAVTEKISGFADRTDDLPRQGRPLSRATTGTMSCQDPYSAGRARSFIAASTMAKFLTSPGFRYSTRVNRQTGIADQPTSRVRAGYCSCLCLQFLQHRPQIRLDGGRFFVAVADAEAAAEIDVVQHDALGGELIDQQVSTLSSACGKRRRIEQLRTDMAVDAADRRHWAELCRPDGRWSMLRRRRRRTCFPSGRSRCRGASSRLRRD
jgi:hypothetical protein